MSIEKNRRDFLKNGIITGTSFLLGCSCFCDCTKSLKSKERKKETMEKMIAFCGLVCSDCPAFIATQKNDDSERQKVAELWSSEEFHIKPEDINCDGCLAVEGKLISFCKDCNIRQCGLEKKVKNCAYCTDYPCEKLTKCHERSPEARATLDEIRKNL